MILDPNVNLHLPFGKSCPTRRIVATFHDTSPFPTWRIIPVSKWLVTMVSKWLVTVVSKSPKWGYSPYRCPKWDDPPSMILLQFPVKEIPKFMISFCTWNQKKRLIGGLGPGWFGFRTDPLMSKGYLEVFPDSIPKPPGPNPP